MIYKGTVFYMKSYSKEFHLHIYIKFTRLICIKNAKKLDFYIHDATLLFLFLIFFKFYMYCKKILLLLIY